MNERPAAFDERLVAFSDGVFAIAALSWAVSGGLLTVYGTRRFGRIGDPFSG